MAASTARPETRHQLKMGLGDAVLRLVHVELRYANGLFEIPDHLRKERELIVQALNSLELDLGFDCDSDGVPDTVEIFQKSAETSCCRIVGRSGQSRREVPVAPPRRGGKA